MGVMLELPGPSDTLCLGQSCLGSHRLCYRPHPYHRPHTSREQVSHGKLCKESNLVQCGGLKHDGSSTLR